MGLRVMVPLVVSSSDLGLLDIGGLVMSGPFEEPDEHLLRRQTIALGEDVRRVPA